VLNIANYNMHCGMDGWGRPYDYLAAIKSLEADVVVLEEAWTTDGEDEGQAERAAAHLGYQVVTQALGHGRRIRPQPGADDRWIAWPPWRARNLALYMDEVKKVPVSMQAMARFQEAEPGRMSIAVLVRPDWPLEATRVLPLRLLQADRLRRAALVVDFTIEGVPVSVAGTHMSHIHYGSHRNWADLRAGLRDGARPDAVLAGDMNTWGPLVRRYLPGWHRAVKGATWPAWRPHSQIDHILTRGKLRAASGAVCPAAGSDHRPVRATLEL
jgi:endonuclease/exonuclease/phosphatase family metal-dependent hydrolase